MGMNRFVIIGASPLKPTRELLDAVTSGGAKVILADGGAGLAGELANTAFAFVGDGDSVKTLPEDCMRVMLPREKDMSDLESAVDLAISNRAEEIILLGCTGGRLDHSLSAFGVLERAAASKTRSFIMDPSNLMFFQDGGNVRYPDLGYDYFSIIPLEQKLIGVSLSGLKYALDDETLKRSGSMGLSNEFIAKSAYVSIRRGSALIVYSSEREHIPTLDFDGE